MPDMTDRKQRLPELDGIRGLAILLILLVHFVGYSESFSFPSPLFVMKPILYLAWSGVDLFFVLSGFLIAGILIDNRTATNFFQVFYLRRISRTFPLYYLLLALFVSLAALPWDHHYTWITLAFDHAMPLGSYLTFTQNFFMAGAGGFGALALAVTWSLAVEEQFYLLFPILIRLIAPRLLPAVFMVGVAFSAITRTFVTWAPGYFLLPFRLDGLLCGALLAYVVRQPAALSRLRQHKRAAYAFLFVLLAGSIGAGSSSNGPALLGSFRFTWMALLYVTLLAITVIHPDSFVTKIFKIRPLVWLGLISYGVYLFHSLINFLVHGLWLGRTPYVLSSEGAVVTFVAAIATLLFAQLLHTWVERPIIAFAHKARYVVTEPAASEYSPRIGDPIR